MPSVYDFIMQDDRPADHTLLHNRNNMWFNATYRCNLTPFFLLISIILPFLLPAPDCRNKDVFPDSYHKVWLQTLQSQVLVLHHMT